MKNILLIGVGRFGRHIAMHLNQLGHQVMAVDRNEERIDAVMPYVTNAQIGDSVNADFLRSLGVGNYDVCIVTIGSSFQDSLETACLLKELGAKWVVSRAERDVQEKFLLRNGADQVVYPEKQMAKWTAIRYSSDHVFDYIEIDSQYAIFEVEIPENWIGKNVGQLDIRKKYGINILATRNYHIFIPNYTVGAECYKEIPWATRKYGKTDVAVSPETVLNGDATILVLGEYKAIQKCFRI